MFLFSVATERLNDKSNAVRLNAAKNTKILLLDAPDMNAYKDESRIAVVKGLKMILLNADDEDQRIREAVSGTIFNE
jgi:ABC-type sugar transport system substrate-binding protein